MTFESLTLALPPFASRPRCAKFNPTKFASVFVKRCAALTAQLKSFFTKGICKQMHSPPTPQSHSSAHAVPVTTAKGTRHQRSPASTLTSTKGDSSAEGGEDTAGADSEL